jgi:hypothetical protein
MSAEINSPISMSEIEEGYEVKDDSRPFFQRQPCMYNMCFIIW